MTVSSFLPEPAHATAVRAPRPGRRRVLGAAGATLVAAGLLVGLAPVAAQASTADNQTVLDHLDALRAAHGLGSLTEISPLMSLAAGHSAVMASQEQLFHNPSLTSEAPSNWQVLGENVGMGPSATAIDVAFDNSPEHFANEVNPAYTEVGIGTAYDTRGYLYITVDFMRPMSVTVAPTPAAPVVHVAAPAPASNAAPMISQATADAALHAVATPTQASHARFAAARTAAAPAARTAAARPAGAVAQAPSAATSTAALPTAITHADPVAAAFTFSADLVALRAAQLVSPIR